MGNVKAATILARIQFVRDRYGERAKQELIERLTPRYRDMLMAGMSPSSWAPFEFFIEVNVSADRMYGYGDLSMCYAMGRYAAAVNVPAFYRMFIRAGNPRFTLKRTPRIYSSQFDSGRVVTMNVGRGGGLVRLEDVDTPHRAHCLGIMGWATRAVEMAGGIIEEAFEVRCRTRGDPVCEIFGQWS